MWKLPTLALLALVVSCDYVTGPAQRMTPGDPGRLIRDALHDGGNPFFFWLAPMVSQPKSSEFGTADPAANPVVRIVCQAASDPASCPGDQTGSLVTSFGMDTGVTFADEQYQLDFDTKAAYDGYSLVTSEVDQNPFTTYRVEVWIPGANGLALIGLADFQLGGSGGEARNLSQPDEIIGLKDGRVLPVKFRIETFAYDVATSDENPCPNGCSKTEIDAATGGTAYYHDEATGVAVTGVLFEANDLPALPDGEEYTLLIGPLVTSDQPSDDRDLCAFDVDLQKYDCFRYTILPDPDQFNNPVRFGVCPRTVPESDYRRLVKVDRDDNDQPVVTFPDPVDVSDFLPCDFPAGTETALLERVLRFAFDRLVPPLFAQTTTRTWGGMADDFSDVFHTIEEGLISHWTADQLLFPYNDAMLYQGTQNNGTPNHRVDILQGGGIVRDAFRFASPVFDQIEGGQTEVGGVILAPAHGIGGLQTLSLSAWVRIRQEAPQNVIQRFVTIQPEKAVIRMDGDTEPGQLHFYAAFEGAEGPELVHVRFPGPLPQGCYQHVAGTYDGATLRLYLNGVEVASTPHQGNLIAGTGVELSSDHETLRGRMDEVRIHDRALTADEVAALYAAGDPDPCPLPPAVHSIVLTESEVQTFVGNTTQLEARLFDASGAELLDRTVSWTSTNASVATVDQTGLVTAVAPGTTRIDAASDGVSASATVEVLSGLLLHYGFDGDLENSGPLTGYTGTGKVTSFSFVDGKFGQAILFDGTSETGVTLPGTAEVFAAGGNQWTISLWFKEDEKRPNTRLLDFRGPTQGWHTYHGVEEPGQRMITCSDGGCFSFVSDAGVWHNLVYRYAGVSTTEGAPIDIFVNGLSVGQVENPNSIPLLGSDVRDVVLGTAGSVFLGAVFAVDELKVYNVAFTDALQCTEVIGGVWSENQVCVLP